MPLDHDEQRGEASWYDEALLKAWPDIQAALATHGTGFKKHVQEGEAQKAFDRAAQILEEAFGTPALMSEALSSDAPIPSGIDRQLLLHFAGRWKGEVEKARRIKDEHATSRGTLGMIILHGNRNPRKLTPEEDAHRREEKKRNKKKKD